jgi:hypothetical protein
LSHVPSPFCFRAIFQIESHIYAWTSLDHSPSIWDDSCTLLCPTIVWDGGLIFSSFFKEEIFLIIKYLDANQSANTSYHNLRDLAKAVLRQMFITINYIQKEERIF